MVLLSMAYRNSLNKPAMYLALLGLFFALPAAPLLHPAMHCQGRDHCGERNFRTDDAPRSHVRTDSYLQSPPKVTAHCAVCSFLSNYHAYRGPVLSADAGWFSPEGFLRGAVERVSQRRVVDSLKCRAPPFLSS